MSLATQDKKTGKKNTLAKKTKERGGKGRSPAVAEIPHRPEIPGLALLSLVVVSVISLLSEYVNVNGKNLLGPFVGQWWSETLNHSVGSLPILFYLAGLTLLALKLIMGREGWRSIVILLAMGFSIGMLLSIRHVNQEVLLPLDFQLSGGWIGNFLAKRIFLPIFGPTQFGPYLVTCLLLFLLLVWGGKLSISSFLSRSAGVAGAMSRSLAEGWKNGNNAETVSPGHVIASEKTKVFSVGKSVLAENGVDQRQLPKKEDTPEMEKAKLEALLDSGNLEGLDPFIIRQIRDLAMQRKRVSELNEWEQKAGSPEISGMLAKEASVSTVSESTPNKVADSSPEIVLPKKTGRKRLPVDFAPIDDTEAEETTPVELAKVNSVQKIKEEPAVKPLKVQYDVYRLPSLDAIFPTPPQQPLEFSEEELRVQSKVLEDQLLNFKVMGKVTQIHPGPVITRYEVELAPGVKVSRISNLSDDLALALKAKSIRILAPIPGKSVVGIEVPNRKAQIVYIKEILVAPEFKLEDDSLKVAVGKTIGGEPYVADLTRAPHLLIAGQTGSGKSVCINSIMASILASKTPDQLRMILVDPKVVELKPYDSIPHLLYPVITQPDVAVQALKWSTVEMDRRYEVLAQCGVRNIKGFNQKQREGKLPPELPPEDAIWMPFILIVIDELADLMMVAGKEVETNIARIAQKARAVGIHLILATQRPSTNVITGTIKANLPTRMAFQVASQIDARTILDRQGAEKLLGRGDMLFRPVEFPEPIRLHGCFIDDEQCEKIAEACSSQFVNYPQIQSFNLEEDPGKKSEQAEERDAKFEEAAELVVQLKQASVSLLQRRLSLGYARSGRLVDQLERAGIVGRERGSKPREVLMAEEELRSFLGSNRAANSLGDDLE